MRNESNWPLYYEKTAQNEARITLVTAVNSFKNENFVGKAFDLGSGSCSDLRYLLANNWSVCAVDNEASSKKYFDEVAGKNNKASFQLCSFEEIVWHPVDLVQASFSLAFCAKQHFPALMVNIISNIQPSGRFSGNFFGPEHSWQDLNLVNKEEVLELFKGFEIELLEETKEERTSTLNETIFHHNINIVAKKPVSK